MNNEVYYVKQKKLLLPVTGLKLVKIPILESVQLNFYQKYIILLLQKGFLASDRQNLIEKISETLNVSTSCVEDFVNYLVKEKNISFNAKKKMYSLKDNIAYSIDKEHNNVMFAELDTKLADCDNVLFLDNFNEICFDSAFQNKDLYKLKNANASQTSIDNIKTVLSNFEDEIKNGITECFKNSNYHLKNEFSYELTSELRPYNVEFDASVTYKYSKATKEAIKVDISVPKGNDIPGHIIDKLSETIKNDDKLPRFISLEESFYEKSITKSNDIDESETNVTNLEDEINPLNQLVLDQKEELAKLKKEHKKELKELEDECNQLKKDIKAKDESIESNKSLVEKYKKENVELAIEFKNSIKELNTSKDKLSEDLKKKEEEVKSLSKKHEESENKQKELIQSQEAIIKEKNKELNNLVNENKKANNSLDELVEFNRKNLDPKTIQIIDKFSNEHSLFCRYVRDICIGMDKAISASDSEAIDEIVNAIDTVRIKSRKTVQVIFDSLFNKNAPNLADYFSTPQKCIDLERLFISHKSTSDVMRRLIKYHYISNATTHLVENNQKSKENKELIDSFKNSTAHERRQILFALHDFFLTFEFTGQEKKSFSAKLKI